MACVCVVCVCGLCVWGGGGEMPVKTPGGTLAYSVYGPQSNQAHSENNIDSLSLYVLALAAIPCSIAASFRGQS